MEREFRDSFLFQSVCFSHIVTQRMVSNWINGTRISRKNFLLHCCIGEGSNLGSISNSFLATWGKIGKIEVLNE